MGRSQAGTAQWSVLGSVGSGDRGERTVRALYDEQVTALYRYVLRLVDGDHHRAEDIVQEAMLRCWRHQDLSLDGTALRPWLFRVARNLVIDAARRRGSGPKEFDASEWLGELSSGVDETEALLSAVVVNRALRRLSAAHRRVLFETFFLGRSGPEAAVVIGVAPGTVKSRLHFALRALRQALVPGDARPADGAPRGPAVRRPAAEPGGCVPAAAPSGGGTTHGPTAAGASPTGRYFGPDRLGAFCCTGARRGEVGGDTSNLAGWLS